MKTLSELLSKREELVKKREVERSVADANTIAEAQRLVSYWEEKMGQSEAGGGSIVLLEQQLAAAKANHERSLRYHTTHLKNARENLRLAQLGENKKTQKLSAEIDLLDKDIAIAKVKETGDSSDLDSLITARLERSKKFLESLAPKDAPAPPPPKASYAPAPPPPEAVPDDHFDKMTLEEKEKELERLRAARKVTPPPQNNPEPSSRFLPPGGQLLTSTRPKKEPKKATRTAADL